MVTAPPPALLRAARYGASFRSRGHPISPAEGAEALRRRFCVPLPRRGRDETEVIDALIAAAEPGLVGNTDGRFFAWVMGASDTTGVAADWLTSIWGQNAAIYQTSPAAAIAEEAVSAWLLEMLDLPRESSVGFVTGATMAGFVGLAAARHAVLARAGYDLDRDGLQGAPLMRIFLSDDAHVANLAALRYLGFGEANLVRIPSDDQGVMRPDALAAALAAHEGPKIVIAQAGHINSGGFDDFETVTALAQAHGAWLHVDGAFGLWLRALPEKRALTRGLDRADSWAVDGHKWLQIPYDSGFAIVRDARAHARAMAMPASYLSRAQADGRNPSDFNPELSRRARGFAAWAVFQRLGTEGIREMISGHCRMARDLAARLARIDGIEVLNRVDANQVVFTLRPDGGEDEGFVARLAGRLNASSEVFLRTDRWRGRLCIRVSVIAMPTEDHMVAALAERIAQEYAALRAERLACQSSGK